MDSKELKKMITETIIEVRNSYKYHDDFSREMGTRLVKLFVPFNKSIKQYRIENSGNDVVLFKFYLSVITYTPKHKDQFLTRLLQFSETYNSEVRMYLDNNLMCVEIQVPRKNVATNVR
jgi:hypothetical protein